MQVPPPVVGLGAAILQRLLTQGAPRPGAPGKLAAGGVVAASAVLAAGAEAQFRGAGTTVDPIHPERASALVTAGPYSVTRNPMYTGLAGALLAHAILRRSWKALLPVAGFVVYIDRMQIAHEEAALHERFGAEYDAYRARVPRWLGPPS